MIPTHEITKALQDIQDALKHNCDPDYIIEKAKARYTKTNDPRFLFYFSKSK